jgi:DNA topoisomerase 2-associated protein PAT1
MPQATKIQNFAPTIAPSLISPHQHYLPTYPLAEGMSFFGFNTNLPRDRDGPGARGFFENPDPFAEVARANALEDDDV